MMASDRTFGAILPSLGDGSGEEIDGEASEALVTAGDHARAARAAATAVGRHRRQAGCGGGGERDRTGGEERDEQEDSVVAILGRVPMGPKELRSPNMVTAERRIIDVLTSPRGGRSGRTRSPTRSRHRRRRRRRRTTAMR